MSPEILAASRAPAAADRADASSAGATTAASAGPPPAAGAGVPHIPADWARPAYNRAFARATVHDLVTEESRDNASARPAHFGTVRPDKYATFAARFDEAAIPGCLAPNALKHQPPRIGPIAVGGLLALPFLVVAAVRGKCN